MKMIRTTRGLLKIVVFVALYLAVVILPTRYPSSSPWLFFLLLAVPPQIFCFTIIVMAVRTKLPFQAAVQSTRRSPSQLGPTLPPDPPAPKATGD